MHGTLAPRPHVPAWYDLGEAEQLCLLCLLNAMTQFFIVTSTMLNAWPLFGVILTKSTGLLSELKTLSLTVRDYLNTAQLL
jgi:hypothetical protein